MNNFGVHYTKNLWSLVHYSLISHIGIASPHAHAASCGLYPQSGLEEHKKSPTLTIKNVCMLVFFANTEPIKAKAVLNLPLFD